MSKTYLIFGDLHFPFQHPLAFLFLKELKKLKPDIVIDLGDMFDFYSMSAFKKNLAEMKGGNQEWEELEASVYTLAEIFPNLVALSGNHHERINSRMADCGIPKKLLKNPFELFDIDWQFKDKYEDKNLVAIHGTQLSGKYALQRAIELFRKNIVFGHTHAVQGISYHNNGENVVFAATPGCLVDRESYAQAYADKCRDKILNGAIFINEDLIPTIYTL